MKKHLMSFGRFDQNRIGKQTIYIFPLPHGPRCIVRVEYDPIEEETAVRIHNTEERSWPDIADFVPDLSEWFGRLYHALFNEPDPRFTRNGKQVVFPAIILDVILHDRTDGNGQDEGSADRLAKRLEDFDLIGAPAPRDTVCALVMCVMLEEEYAVGSTRCDLWWQRSWLQRGLLRSGLCNPYSHPRPPLRELAQAPRQWHWERNGIASDRPDDNWAMIENCFNRSFRAALVVDVWQPWAVNGNALQLIREEDIEV